MPLPERATDQNNPQKFATPTDVPTPFSPPPPNGILCRAIRGQEMVCVRADIGADLTSACTSSSPSLTYACGNGTIDIAYLEECDDGNTHGGDGCNARCQLEDTPTPEPELCDDDTDCSPGLCCFAGECVWGCVEIDPTPTEDPTPTIGGEETVEPETPTATVTYEPPTQAPEATATAGCKDNDPSDDIWVAGRAEILEEGQEPYVKYDECVGKRGVIQVSCAPSGRFDFNTESCPERSCCAVAENGAALCSYSACNTPTPTLTSTPIGTPFC